MDERPTVSSNGHRHLSGAPLIRVLCQITWPSFPAFNPEEAISQLGMTLVNKYPIEETRRQYEMVLTPTGVRQDTGENLYRLSSVDGTWNVTLAKTFISLETTKYCGHIDFIERLGEVIDTLIAVFQIPTWLHIGYRYTNRISGDDLSSLKDFFTNPSVLGGASWTPKGTELRQSITESVYTANDITILIRSASLENGVTVDPTFEPIDEPSWVLDLDASFEAEQGTALSSADIQGQAEVLSEACYGLFEDLISERFVERYK